MKTFKLNELIRPNIKALKPYSSARDEYKSNSDSMIFLDANENPYNSEYNRYPDPQQQDLKQVISKIKNVSKKQILLGNGSDEVLDLIFRAFCNPGKDNIITLPPTYGMYNVLAETNDILNIKVNLNTNFEPDVDAILKAQTEITKILFICSPNNPTSNTFTSNKIETLITNFNGIVVIDEAYIDFSDSESWLNNLNKFPNLIITQTLSKAYGLASIRLGICYASEAIISVLNTIKPPYNINGLTQNYAINALKHKEKTLTDIQLIKKQRQIVKEALKEISFIKKIYNSDANFLLIKVDDANLRYNQLLKNGFVVRNRTKEPLCNNCLRITIGTEKENRKLIDILKKIN